MGQGRRRRQEGTLWGRRERVGGKEEGLLKDRGEKHDGRKKQGQEQGRKGETEFLNWMLSLAWIL